MMNLATILLLASLVVSQSAFAQDSVSRFPKRNPVDNEVIKYEKVSELPLFFVDAFNAITCGLSDRQLEESPVLFFRGHPESRPMVLVNCDRTTSYSGHVFWFEKGKLEEMTFVVPSYNGGVGFGTKKNPGFVTWDANLKLLTARQNSDICPSYVSRTTYSMNEFTQASWSLIRIEVAEFNCTDDLDWKMYWEATPWQRLPKR